MLLCSFAQVLWVVMPETSIEDGGLGLGTYTWYVTLFNLLRLLSTAVNDTIFFSTGC